MRPVTDRWREAIKLPHTAITRSTLLNTDGTTTELEPISGQVTLDFRSAVRGRFDAALEDDGSGDLVPSDYTDLLTPYGNEIQVERGIRYADGDEELVSLGVFGIEDAEVVDEDDNLTIRVSGLDRAQRMVRSNLETPVEFASGFEVAEAILNLGLAAWPEMPYDSLVPTASTATLPKVIASEGDDRWVLMQGMAEAIGLILFFDGDGILQLKPYQSVYTGEHRHIHEGDGGVLVSAGTHWTREAAFNKVIATGENTELDEVYRGEAQDNTVASPTFYGGPFGKVPVFWSSPYISSNDSAQDAATSKLSQELGVSKNVNFGMVPNPAFEPGDEVHILRARSELNETFIIDSVQIGLASDDGMTAETRQKTVAQ
jgi:hypothetical protein